MDEDNVCCEKKLEDFCIPFSDYVEHNIRDWQWQSIAVKLTLIRAHVSLLCLEGAKNSTLHIQFLFFYDTPIYSRIQFVQISNICPFRRWNSSGCMLRLDSFRLEKKIGIFNKFFIMFYYYYQY